MSGLASLSRHFAYAWMTEPKPGELEYLAGVKSVAIGSWYRAGARTVNTDTVARAVWPHDGAKFNRRGYSR
jgi:hypothetical protein